MKKVIKAKKSEKISRAKVAEMLRARVASLTEDMTDTLCFGRTVDHMVEAIHRRKEAQLILNTILLGDF